MKIASIVDSPVSLMYAAAVSRVLRQKHTEILVNIGPHTAFFQARAHFEHVDLLEPEVSLEIGSGASSAPFGELLNRLERFLLDLRPDLVMVRGDSGAALAAALAAARQYIPVAQLEAGVRSYSKRLPHELNQVLTDHLADVLFCRSHLAAQQLAAEGILSWVHNSGDIELDIIDQYLPVARQHSSILQRIGLYPGYYLLTALHSAALSSEPDVLHHVTRAFNTIREPIVFPMSAQLRAAFDRFDLVLAPHVLAIEPVGYLDLLSLAAQARAILTDNQVVQREAYHLAVPCITLCDSTEVRETVATGWNCLVGSQTDRIIDAVRDFLPPIDHPLLFGDGHAAEQIATVLSAQPVVFGQNYDRVVAPLLTDATVM